MIWLLRQAWDLNWQPSYPKHDLLNPAPVLKSPKLFIFLNHGLCEPSVPNAVLLKAGVPKVQITVWIQIELQVNPDPADTAPYV